ncbi:unnamed protein product [Paramecium octaurelia]|uniref:Uncharacterized protein n=1 Tax=Paramecium octaurelia TaxID=43137 RepID=A0A8S1S7L6_PAROT|nr:unnamed protein product [Paramecium octaurelia]
MPIVNSDQINPWFVNGQNHNEAFVDWEGNRVRNKTLQCSYFNFQLTKITLKISTQSEFYPFIQESLQLQFPEVDEIIYTLLPKSSYQLAI